MNKGVNNLIKSKWITANAGSGKTTALTARVVALLLHGVVPERICCITYTKAAASEMRGRVLSRLRKLLLMSDEDCAREVEKLIGRPATPEHLKRARHLFGQVLDSPLGGVQLTTIHGFCQNILRRFPMEAGLAPHFTVLEDGASDQLLKTVTHRLLSNIENADGMLANALGLLGERSGEARFADLVTAIIQKRGMWQNIWHLQTPELLRARIFAEHGVDEKTTQSALEVAFCRFPSAEDAAIMRAHLPQLLSHKNKGEQNIGQVLSRWLELPADARSLVLADCVSLFVTEKNTKRVRLLNEKQFPADAPLRLVLERFADVASTFAETRAALAAAEESFAVAIIARALLDLYAQAKDAMHALDYDDLIIRTRQLFSLSENLGWVMSKLDHRIDHLLIDEAQDTSADQWHIAQALVEELIASDMGVGSGDQPRSLLVVGDEKQSIYSFQGAAPALFSRNEKTFQSLLEHSNAPIETETLGTSYRSAEAVLKLVNHVAAQPAIAKALSASGESPPHQLHRAEAAGQVMLYVPIEKPEKTTLPSLTIPMEYQIVRSGAQVLAEQVAARIAGWLSEKRLLASEHRAIEAGDILILVHRRKPLVMPLIRALERLHVPVAGLDRLTLSDHLAVKDLLALMRWCGHVGDDLALAQVLRSPIIGISDEALRVLAYGRTGSLWAQVQATEHATLLNRWLKMRDALPYDFLTDVLEVMGTRTQFAQRFGGEVHEVLDELKEQAAAMPADMPRNLTHFVDWVSGSKRSIKREQETGAANQVRIMTVHGAKGLEAPVVLMVDTDSVPDTRRELVYFSATEKGQILPIVALSEEAKFSPLLLAAKDKKRSELVDEYQRLLYVALTRARDELHVFGFASKKTEKKSDAWYDTVETSMQALGAEQTPDGWWLRDVQPASSTAQKTQPSTVHVSTPAWLKTPAPVLSNRVMTPSSAHPEIAAEAKPYGVENAKKAKARGVRIHRILQMLHAQSDEAHIARHVRHVAPDWTADEQQGVVAEVSALLQQHRFLWEHRTHAEASIAGTIDINGAATEVNGQIDLLVETPTEVVVVDYKTGRNVPSSTADVSENYRLQLKMYQALLRQIYPEKPVRVAILWTSTPSLMWLDEVVENTPWNMGLAA